MDNSRSTEQPQSSAQLGLLVAVMILFIAIWESDSKHHQQVALREATRHVQVAQAQRSQAGRTAVVKLVSEPKSPRSAIKLPAGIVPGEYRVVSSNGSVENRWISFNDIRAQRLMPGREARDLYLLDDSEQRTYFIRVTEPTSIALHARN